MSTRTLALALLTIAASALTACADVTSPTSKSSIGVSTHASLDVNDPVCRAGTWSSSTGRCE
ncbi:MAG TPA: hypothetical protein VGP25_21005 [Gemmatimonadaceae bacterium]|nr:hypothetical protein [Gemmatimonadaceae bacterium]